MAIPDLVPARMLNEFVYCPRLFYLEWVQGEWADTADTEEGRLRHRRVDEETGGLSASEEAEGRIHARSITLSAERYGLIARIDLVEGEGSCVSPVDYKSGATPDNPERSWEPDQVQVCAQALILRESGYNCDEGYLYYAESRQRVCIPITDDLISRTLGFLAEARATAEVMAPPLPLSDSPKCPRCSLVGICLPDEVHYLSEGETSPEGPRRLLPARDDALPMYIQTQGLTAGRSGDRLVVKEKGRAIQDVRLLDVSQLCIFGNVQVTTQLMQELMDRNIPLCFFTYGGWFYGMATGFSHKNVLLRRRQYEVAADATHSLALAARFVEAKIKNARTLLRRNSAREPSEALGDLATLSRQVREVNDVQTLLGLEGLAARHYFQHFGDMLKPKEDGIARFDFGGRNRRPPRDPVNALLSYAYALLVKDLTVVCQAVGLDPYLGFFHTPRYGRPSLALDLMEEFRPIIADSVVIGVVNNGEIATRDFRERGGAWTPTTDGRRKLLGAYDRRMDQLVTHPVFGYSISYRRVLEVQVRLLGRHLMGEIPDYPQFLTR